MRDVSVELSFDVLSSYDILARDELLVGRVVVGLVIGPSPP